MGRFLTIFALFLLLVIITVLMPVNKKYGYSKMVPVCEQSDWLYHRIFEDDTPIDIAFIGTSQTMLAVQDSLMMALFREKGKQNEVANLGFCENGRSLHYALIKDLLAHHRLKAIVLECRTREDLSSHRDFGRIAMGNDVLFPQSIINSKYFRDLFIAFGSRIGGWFSGASSEIEVDQSYGYRYSGNLLDSLHLEKRGELERRRTEGRSVTGVQKRLVERYPKAHLRAIAELTKANNAELYFLYLPTFAYRQEGPEERELYEELGTLLLPPPTVLKPTSNWSDLVHLNGNGAVAVARWMVGEDVLSF